MRAEKEKTRTDAVASGRVYSFDQGSKVVPKQTRRSTATQAQRTVKTSVLLDAEVHVKLAALAAMRGVPMTTIMADAIADVVSSMVVFDRAKTPKPVDSPFQGRESASENGDLAA
jgi:hypothetical protein